jgi:hypothetical protein
MVDADFLLGISLSPLSFSVTGFAANEQPLWRQSKPLQEASGHAYEVLPMSGKSAMDENAR